MSTTTSKAGKSKTPSKSSKAPKKETKSDTSSSKIATLKPRPTTSVSRAAPAPAKVASPTVVDAPQAVILGPVMRKKELIEAVVTRSGMKKKDVKPVVEAMLSVMGDALGDNRELNLPPFGQLKVRKEKQLRNGRMVVAKIRQNKPPASSDVAKASDTEKS